MGGGLAGPHQPGPPVAGLQRHQHPGRGVPHFQSGREDDLRYLGRRSGCRDLRRHLVQTAAELRVIGAQTHHALRRERCASPVRSRGRGRYPVRGGTGSAPGRDGRRVLLLVGRGWRGAWPWSPEAGGDRRGHLPAPRRGGRAVAVLDLDGGPAEAVAGAIRQDGGAALALTADVARRRGRGPIISSRDLPRRLRVLEGPNLYFPRAAVKLTLDLSPIAEAGVERALRLARRIGLSTARPGAPGSGFRQRFALRAVERLVRAIAAEAGTRGWRYGCAHHNPDVDIVAFPWRHRGRAQALGRAVAHARRAGDPRPRRSLSAQAAEVAVPPPVGPARHVDAERSSGGGHRHQRQDRPAG